MKLTYRVIKDANGYLAECVESDAAGEGKTSQAAVESLRTALKERMFRPDAVAPPSETEREPIELTLAKDAKDANEETSNEKPTLDLGGPGEAPLPSRAAR